MRTLLALIALALSAPALAADEPGTFGMAQRGSFKLVAGVILNAKGGEMKGVWLDAKQGCLARRTFAGLDLHRPRERGRQDDQD